MTFLDVLGLAEAAFLPKRYIEYTAKSNMFTIFWWNACIRFHIFNKKPKKIFFTYDPIFFILYIYLWVKAVLWPPTKVLDQRLSSYRSNYLRRTVLDHNFQSCSDFTVRLHVQAVCRQMIYGALESSFLVVRSRS